MGTTIVIIDPIIALGGADVSERCRQVDLEIAVDLQPSTHFLDEWVEFDAGLKTWVATLNFYQDFDETTGMDERLWDMLGVKTTLTVRYANSPITRSNPQYEGAAFLEAYPPFGNGVGEVMEGHLIYRGTGPLRRRVT